MQIEPERKISLILLALTMATTAPMTITITNLYLTSPAILDRALAGITGIATKLDQLAKGQISIMNSLQDAQAALEQIDATTNKQAAALEAEGASLQQISDEMTALIQTAKDAGASQALIDGLVAQASKVAAIGTTIDAHAELSKAIAAAGAPVPVVEVPPVTGTAPDTGTDTGATDPTAPGSPA